LDVPADGDESESVMQQSLGGFSIGKLERQYSVVGDSRPSAVEERETKLEYHFETIGTSPAGATELPLDSWHE
jgi:hypothetical protein